MTQQNKRRIGEKLLSALQQPCLLCGDRCEEDCCLCKECFNGLPIIGHACEQCGIPLPGEAVRCGACLTNPPFFNRCLSALDYRSPVDYLIKHLKYHNQLSVANLLANLLAKKIRQRNQTLPQVIIPVPLHESRLQQRGYNQSIEIARPLSRELRIPFNITHCVRQRNTVPQFDLPAKQRSQNIKNAFEMVADLPFEHVAILDDIMTTGSTANELSRVLQAAGARHIEVWTCARANLDN